MQRRKAAPGLMLVVGGALMALGGLMPWVKIQAPFLGFRIITGLDAGDGGLAIAIGIFTVVLGVVVLSSAALPGIVLRLLAIAAALLGGVVAGRNLGDIPRVRENMQATFGLASTTVGRGLYVILAGAGLSLAGALFVRHTSPKPRTDLSLADVAPPAIPGAPPAPPRLPDTPPSTPRPPSTGLCVNGHPWDPQHRYCPVCGGERWS